jgi:hypothetical protein
MDLSEVDNLANELRARINMPPVERQTNLTSITRMIVKEHGQPYVSNSKMCSRDHGQPYKSKQPIRQPQANSHYKIDKFINEYNPITYMNVEEHRQPYK